MGDQETEIKTQGGDIRIRKEGTASEVTIPWSQYFRMMLAIGIAFCGLTAVALLVEWPLLYVPVLALCGWLVMCASRRGRGLELGRVAALGASAMLLMFWAMYGVGLCQRAWIFPRVAWPWQVRLYAVAGIAAIVIAPAGWIAYRYAAEIIDPSGPTAPRSPTARAGVQWPWTPEPPMEEPGLTRDEIRDLLREEMAQRPILRVETTAGDGNGNGRVPVGGRIVYDALPADEATLRQVARAAHLGRIKWSRRDIGSLRGIGDERARAILAGMVEGGFLHYPEGPNHPDGAQATAKGQALLRGLLRARRNDE